MELIVPDLDHGPANDLIGVYEVIFALVVGQLRILGDTVCAAIRVNDGLAAEQTHDVPAHLCRHDSGHHSIVGPAGGQQRVGDFAHSRHAIIHSGDTFHDVRNLDHAWVNGCILRTQRCGIVGAAGFQKLDHTGFIILLIVEGVVLVLRQFRSLAGYLDGIPDSVKGQGDFVIGHFVIPGGSILFHCLGIKDIAEDNRLLAEQLEVRVNDLADGILLPVVREAQLLHRFIPGSSDYRLIDLTRLLRHVRGSGPYHIG